ncbi:MAG: hypothetical protein HYV16_00350 [Gammaproteobacteria bacterium]|nr:hypothetical protein [Gammaproteobacteria bacterium]
MTTLARAVLLALSGCSVLPALADDGCDAQFVAGRGRGPSLSSSHDF